ncbi:tetratricopeptide (TPR) repeat protein [Sphingomonas jinjuensis]|uniref:Tetratricopeptide (TPR) repeat protein n=1 Tax=Sphingomonas jinjuensis TaxID=535907 RepID=A0A840F8C5_9SPHN|nr:tetratricopeptide repeat protein [Sphingomonas jinjuensis]MBB4152781.1 tetratricopeptide (TPR) repeat protein [Sphingomonas jinjuensis]
MSFLRITSGRRFRRALLASTLLALAACQSPSEKAAALGAQAQQLFEQQRYYETSLLLQKALRARDDVPELWLLLGRAKIAMGDYPGAYAAYRSALDLDRANREAMAAVAQLSLNRGDFAGADDIATQIQALAPDDVLAALVRGYAALGQQRYDDALGIADGLIKQDGSNVAARVIRSMALERQGQIDEALAALKPVADQTSPDLLSQLQRLYERTADPRAIAGVLHRQLAATPQRADLRLGLARQAYTLGANNDGAEQLAAALLRSDKDDLRQGAIAVWMESGAAPAAVIASVGSLSRDVPTLRLALAQYLLARGMGAEALAQLKDVGPPAAAKTDDASRQGTRALAEAMSGQLQSAATRAAATLQLDDNEPFALMALARLALARGDTNQALRDSRVVLRDNPRLPMAYRLLAEIYTKRDEGQLADRTIDDGATANPDSGEYLAMNIPRLIAQGNVDEAMDLSRDFTIRNPASMTGWLTRLQACRKAGDAECVRRGSIIAARLAGKGGAFPAIPDDERPTDQPRWTI